MSLAKFTVDVERFARLKFTGFQEYYKSFSMNKYLCVRALYNDVVYKYFKSKIP